VREARPIITVAAGDYDGPTPVPPNIAQTSDNDQDVEEHHRYDRH